MQSSTESIPTGAPALPLSPNLTEQLHECPLCRGNCWKKVPLPTRSIGADVFAQIKAQLGLLRCRDCGLVFVNPRPAKSLLDIFYGGNNYVCHGDHAGSSATAQFLLDVVARYGPYQNKRFLDFGCGGGFLLAAAREAGWSATGFDVGEKALETCAKKKLLAVRDLEQLRQGSFDVIVLNHVFEHIAEQQQTLIACRGLLTKTGKVFVVVPNLAGLRAHLSFRLLSRYFAVDERHRAFPIHLFYFTPATLTRTLEKAGFCVTSVETFGLGLEELFVSPRENSQRGSPSHVSHSARKSSPFRHIVKKTLSAARLGENLLVVAQPL